MDLEAVIDRHIKSVDQLKAEELKQLKREFFSHSSPPFDISNDDALSRFIYSALNLCFGNPKTVSEIFDPETAKDFFRAKVLEKKIKGKLNWISILGDMGTHHPKTQNDKVSSGAVSARWNGVKTPKSVVTSLNCPDGGGLSGAGNGANNAHYLLLSLNFKMDHQTAALAEWISRDNQAVKGVFRFMGLPEETWESLVKSAENALNKTNMNHLDRQLKQIYIPYPDERGDERFILITPLASTRVISAFEHERKAMAAEQIRLSTYVTKTGGTKPQNAGSLVNELGGWLRHLSMGFKITGLETHQKRLYQIGKGPLFFVHRKDSALKRLQRLLDRDWDVSTGNRQAMIQSVRFRIDDLFRQQLENLWDLSDYVSSQYHHEEGRSLLDEEGHAFLPEKVKSLLDANWKPGLSLMEKREYLRARGMDAVTVSGEAFDDSHLRLISDALDRLIREVWHA